MKSIYLLFLALSFMGCSNLNTKEYTGRYTYGHEVEIFTDEKTGQDYWLYGNVETLNQYMKKLRVSKNTPYLEIKLKIKGIDKGKATNRLAQYNDKVMKVKEYTVIEE